MHRHWVGSVVLFLVVAAVVLRPWEGELARDAPRSVGAVVERVVDGDTVVARVGGRDEYVRLIGVDTPETVKPDTPVQCFGERASHFTRRRLTGRRVRLVFGVEPRDVYGRLLAYVYLPFSHLSVPQHVKMRKRGAGGEGARGRRRLGRRRLFNAALARRGLARPLTIPPNDRFAPRFEGLARAAARAGRGLWGAC